MTLKETVQQAVEDAADSLSFTSDALSRRVILAIKNEVTGEVVKRVREFDDEYVSELEEENHELRHELSQATSQGYSELKNELALHQNLIKKMLYFWNDGDSVEFGVSEIQEMETVDFDFDRSGDDIKVFIEEQIE